MTLNQRLLVRETLGGEALGSAVRLVRYIICFALGAQLVTFLLLFVRLVSKYPPIEALWQSLFHSISAFNNAGFTIFPDSDSLSAFRSDPAVLWTIGLSILLGAMSYPVMNELARAQGVQPLDAGHRAWSCSERSACGPRAPLRCSSSRSRTR